MARNKNDRIYIRLSPEEKITIKHQAIKCRMNMSEYILALNEQKKIYVIDGIPELVVELTRIGTNVNQIATQVNTYKNVSEYQLKQVLNNQEDVKKIMSQILKQIYDYEEDIDI